MSTPLILAILSGVFFGSWSVLLVKARGHKFENFFFMLVIITTVFVTVIALVLEGAGIFRQIGASDLKSIVWGLGGGVCWGLATLSFGYALTLVGLALGYAVILGLAMFVGTSVSMFLMAGLPAGVDPAARIYAMLGVLVALVGTVLSSHAGYLKSKVASGSGQRRSFGRGIMVCAVSGFLSSFFALGYAGAQEHLGTWSSIFLLMLGFSLVQLPILCVRMARSASWQDFKNFRPNVIYPAAGALIFGLAVVCHFASADKVGVALAYPLMMGIQIFVGNLWSFIIFREWDGAPKNARALQVLALVVLVMASVLVGASMGLVS